MISERMKGRELFKSDEVVVSNGKQVMALNLLEDCVDHLVIAMKTIEQMGLFSNEDIEDYVISYLEAFEKRYYLMENDSFDEWLRDYLGRGRS